MPKGRDGMLRKVLSGLSVLAVLVMSVVQAHALVLPVLHVATHAAELAYQGDNAETVASLPAHDDWGAPCKGHDGAHGLACCSASGCPMFAGWLPADATPLPSITPGALSYRDLATPRPDGLGRAPALPPPRPTV
jgi:hypothetical protein